jgi:hypothetical protein
MVENFPDSERPTRPLIPRPALRATGPRMHLMLVAEPKLSPRGLAWTRHNPERQFDGARLQQILRFERLNLG